MGDSTKKSFAALLGTARLPEKTVDICLRGDLAADFAEADEALTKAQKRNLESLAGGGDVGDLLEQVQALQAEMAENTYTFRLRALPKPRFRALVNAHPVRRVPDENDPTEITVHPADRFVGVNAETFFDALIRACLVDPELTDEQWRVFVGDNETERARLTAEGKEDEIVDGKLNDWQYDKLSDTAWGLNRSDVDPFSRVASRMTQASESE
jgi:hypothetical protein